jgi:hypothetical protein
MIKHMMEFAGGCRFFPEKRQSRLVFDIQNKRAFFAHKRPRPDFACGEFFLGRLRAFHRRLRANGKPVKVALMRKLIELLNQLLKYPNFSLAR